MTFSYKHETHEKTNEHVLHADRLVVAAGSVLQAAREAADDAEVFNAALAYASANALSSFQMARVLAVLRQRGEVSDRVVRDWVRDAKEMLGEVNDPGLVDVLLNTEIQQHTGRAAWQYAEIAEELARWFDIFNQALFSNALPRPAISIDRERINNLGWYRPGRDGLALRHRINLNSVYVHGSAARRLAVLLHELLHLWEDVVQGRHGGGGYHSSVFRTKAEELGIPTDAGGHYLGILPESRVAHLFAEHHIELGGEDICAASDRNPKRVSAGQSSAISRSRLVPWTCGCTRIWASGGVTVESVCSKCKSTWQRAATKGAP